MITEPCVWEAWSRRVFLALGKWKTTKGFVQEGSERQVRVTPKESEWTRQTHSRKRELRG